MRKARLTCAAMLALALIALPSITYGQTLAEDAEANSGTAFDRADAYDPGGESVEATNDLDADSYGVSSEDADTSSEDDSDIEAYSIETRSSSIRPMQLSEEMRYFCKYESSQNYDQGLSYGDGYHAMGYYQFDNRYGLGNFLEAVYNYNPTKYSALKQIGDWYDWNTYGDGGNVRSVKSPGGDWTMADDLNWSWHQAYEADPTEFSRLQNYWAYTQYYEPADNWVYNKFGINLDDYSDCARGMVWGMCNLFGYSGWQRWANSAGLYSGMTNTQFVSGLANALVAGIENGTYKYTYGTSYVNRYKNELKDCLGYLGTSAASLAASNKGAIPDGLYSVRMNSARSMALDVSAGSKADGANVQIYGFNATNAQYWQVTNDSDGFITIKNIGSGKVLDVSSATRRNSANVQQWSSNSSDAQKWAAVKQSDGSVVLFSKLGQGLVLDIANGSMSNGANAELYATNGTSAQRFYFRSSNADEAAKHKDDLADGTYSFSTSLNYIKVLDVSSGSKANGANVQLYTSNSTAAQSWKVSHDAEGYVTLTNTGSGKVLDVCNGNAASGANVWQYSSNGTDAQKWIAVKESDGTYTFKSAMNGSYVLDISSASTANGANLQLWSSNGTSAQRFYATNLSSSTVVDAWAKMNAGVLSDGTYVLSSALNSSKVLDVQWGSTANGANVWIYAKNGSTAQSWRVSHDSNGYVTLTNVGSGKALDVSGGVAQNGRNVQQYTPNGTRAQKWIAVKASNGITLQSAIDPSYVLDISGGSTANGANVQIYQSNGTKAQAFNVK